VTIQLETSTSPLDREWDEPTGVGARGTVILLVGRGESGDVYNRFGTRIAADAYRVRTVAVAATDAAAARQRVIALLADDSLPSPKVLVGSDSGAALALELATEGVAAQAVIVAGLPTRQPDEGRGHEWADELEARTACPNHQGVLGRTARAGELWQPLPAGLLAVVASGVTVPVLAIHGGADTISPLSEARQLYQAIPRHEIAVVVDGRHDILNDVTHRSVAATIVLFLERLRLSSTLAPIVETL
jgi:pimeloyl-ACP methyl ester carboxylesterase